jgi:hypothetical protein
MHVTLVIILLALILGLLLQLANAEVPVAKAKLVRVRKVDMGKEVSKLFGNVKDKFQKLKEKFRIPANFLRKSNEPEKKKYDASTIQGRILEFVDHCSESPMGVYIQKMRREDLNTAMVIYVSMVALLFLGIVFNFSRALFKSVSALEVQVVDLTPKKKTLRRPTPRKSTPRRKAVL